MAFVNLDAVHFIFSKYLPDPRQASFESFLKLFLELLTYTSGDAAEALEWLKQLDAQHQWSQDSYGLGDFLRDLKSKGYLDDKNEKGEISITPKTEQAIRRHSFEELFGKLKKTSDGNHGTKHLGQGHEQEYDTRAFQFGDSLDQLDVSGSIHNAYLNHGIDQFELQHDDLQVHEKQHLSHMATVLMIDISHSMILYGEDRITPAKKVAMGLAELIQTRYPKDSLDIIVFGNDAWPVQLKDLPYLQVGPYHTNTCAGLELAVDILRKRKTSNKQIIMITDGKPTCLKEGNGYYKNSFGLDQKVISKTLNMAAQCRRLKIPVTTFMIASDPYLQQFVQEFTEINKGKAYYSNLDGLGNFVFQDFENNRRKNIRS
ncbi:MAG: hypothetical protein MUF42_16170 [Cytophagaceae bacterium]|jgi:uncharacterized protein with von Willebrand factor type A (vWA) domain|nr:hypothetical protein [Cytophagaceae bacterium]